MSLIQLYRKTFNKPLKVYWWRYEYPNQLNFGDEITPILIQKLLGYRTTWADPASCDIAGSGSIIEILQRENRGRPVAIWGSGFIEDGGTNTAHNLRFCAVRGLNSRKRAQSPNIPCGDPALLLPLALKPASKKYRCGIIPHYIDKHSPILLRLLEKNKDLHEINVLNPVEKVVQDITSCEFILSSSLHGLIVADAYGIPNGRLVLSDHITGGDYKYNDYYSVFDSKRVLPTFRHPSAIEMEELITRLADDFVPIPAEQLTLLQLELIRAFPRST